MVHALPKTFMFKCMNFFNFVTCSSGSFSRTVSSPSIKSKKLGLITKKPPLIQLSPSCCFSLKLVTIEPFKLREPNLAGGLTAEIVTVFLCFL